MGRYFLIGLTVALIVFTGFRINSAFRSGEPEAIAPLTESNLTPAELAAIEGETDEPTSQSTTLDLTAALDNPYFLADSDTQSIFMSVDVQAIKSENTSTRTPLNISLVIDRSGSMSGNKIEFALNAAKQVVDLMASDDYISIAHYGSDVQVASTSAKADNKQKLKTIIDGIYVAGGTFLSGGMDAGYAQVGSTHKTDHINRVLLLSDGLANEGVVAVPELQRIAANKLRNDGIAISTFGIGAGFNEILMTKLAENGAGNYHFIEESNDIPEVLKKELEDLFSLVAQKAKVSITFPSEYVKVEKVYGYEYEVKGNKILLDYHDVFSEELKSIMVQFKLLKKMDKDLEIKAALTYEDVLDENNPAYDSETLVLKITTDPQQYVRAFDDKVLSNKVMFIANDRMDRASMLLDEGKYDDARNLIGVNDKYLESNLYLGVADSTIVHQYNANKNYNLEIKNYEMQTATEQSIIQKSNRSYNYSVKTKKVK